jgi:hypothetical protein
MERTRLWQSIAGAGAGVLLGAILVVTGLPASAGPTLELSGRAYYVEDEYLFGSQNFLRFGFEGVLFTFHIWCAVEGDDGFICGNATQLDGISYPYTFVDGLPTEGPPPWQTWFSPDRVAAVQYQDGGQARLLVEAP